MPRRRSVSDAGHPPTLNGLWQADSARKTCSSSNCDRMFTMFRRRHHCRRCGQLFCGYCSRSRVCLEALGSHPQRVCDGCSKLDNRGADLIFTTAAIKGHESLIAQERAEREDRERRRKGKAKRPQIQHTGALVNLDAGEADPSDSARGPLGTPGGSLSGTPGAQSRSRLVHGKALSGFGDCCDSVLVATDFPGHSDPGGSQRAPSPVHSNTPRNSHRGSLGALPAGVQLTSPNTAPCPPQGPSCDPYDRQSKGDGPKNTSACFDGTIPQRGPEKASLAMPVAPRDPVVN